MRGMIAARAYGRSNTLRNTKEQEADIFIRVNAAMRVAPDRGPIAVARAVADDRLLWIAVGDLVRDPDNALPLNLRAAIISVGHAVRRECDNAAPDLAFLIGINEQIVAGLASL